jgi:hypothetical protein
MCGCSDSKQADTFAKTTKEITEHAGCTCRYGSNARLAIENLKAPTLNLPSDPVDEHVRGKNAICGLPRSAESTGTRR